MHVQQIRCPLHRHDATRFRHRLGDGLADRLALLLMSLTASAEPPQLRLDLLLAHSRAVRTFTGQVSRWSPWPKPTWAPDIFSTMPGCEAGSGKK